MPAVSSVRHVVVSIAKNRLVQFFAVGAVLALLAPKEPDGRVIMLGPPRIEEGLQGERLRRGRELTLAEKNAVVSDLVDEEVLAREAVRLGIGTEDPIVRSRLAERMNASYAKALPLPRLDEAEVDAAVSREIERSPERVRLAVWFVAKERTDATATAEKLVKAIASEGIEATRGRGDKTPLPDNTLWTETTLARIVSMPTAHRAFEAEIGKPTEPLTSSWGYFVFVPLERRHATADEVRADAIAKLVSEKQAAEVKRLVRRARRDYTIELKSPDGEPRFDLDAVPPPSSGHVD